MPRKERYDYREAYLLRWIIRFVRVKFGADLCESIYLNVSRQLCSHTNTLYFCHSKTMKALL